MANYVMVYRGGSGNMAPTEEERNAILAAWGAWYGSMGDAVVDGGNPFGPSMSVAPDGTTSDGAQSGLTGYTIVKADTLAAASAMAKGCPILTDGGTIEVYETFAVM
jgi:hypothetical protein